jgi:predicted esterase
MVSVLAVLLLSSTGAPPGANPSQIDPMDPMAGDFLDLDLGTYCELAMESCGAGDYRMAARYFLAYLTRNSGDYEIIYSLACCYGLLGEPELASLYLRRAFSAGFYDPELIRSDPDFDEVRDSPAFQTAMDLMERAAGAPPEYNGESFLFAGPSASTCLYRLPEGYDDSAAVPLVIGLHGYGDSPENFIRLWGLFDSPRFIYACPRAPYPVLLNGDIGWSWFMTTGDPWETAGMDRHSVDFVMAAIDSLRARFSVSRVFLVGFSQGCAVTWLIGLRESGELSGIAGLGGRLETAVLPESLLVPALGLPAFVGNGTEDEKAPPVDGEDAARFLSEHGFEVTLRTWQGGHGMYRSILLEVQRWMEAIAFYDLGTTQRNSSGPSPELENPCISPDSARITVPGFMGTVPTEDLASPMPLST